MADEVGKIVAGVELDVANFRSGITEINREMRVVRSEFQATSTDAGVLGSSFDRLENKSNSLTRQVDLQKQKMALLHAAHQKSVKETGADSRASQNLEIQLNKSTSQLNKMESELGETNTEMKKLTNTTEQTKIKMKELGDKMQTVGSKMKDVGSTALKYITLPLLAAAGAGTKLASDMEESLNKVEVAFKSNAKEVEEWSETTLESFGIAKGTALDAAALFGDMATSMGLTTNKAADMSTGLVGLAGDLASFKNVSLDVANTALKGIFTGETESLKNLGIVMNETNLKAYAMSKGIKSNYSELTQAEKITLRYQYILENTSNAQGDFARTSDSAANQSRMLKERLKEAGAEIGSNLLPIYTSMATKANEIVKAFTDLDGGTQKIIIVVAALFAAIGPVILIAGKLVIAIGAIIKILPALQIGLAIINVQLKAMLANPVVLGIVAVAGAIALIAHHANKSKKELEDMKRELIDIAKAEAEAAREATNDKYDAVNQGLNDELAAEQSAYDERIKLLKDEYLQKVEYGGKGNEALKESLQEQQRQLKESHNAKIKAIQDEYGVYEEKTKSKTDLANEFYDNEKEKVQEAYDKKVELINKELEEHKKQIDTVSNEKIFVLELELKRIKGATSEELEIEKRKHEESLIVEQETLAVNAKNDEERSKAVEKREDLIKKHIEKRILTTQEKEELAIKELIFQEQLAAADARKEVEETATKKIEEAQRVSTEEIAEIEKKRDAEIEAIQEERIEKEIAENAKYEATKSSLDNQLKELERYGASYSRALQEELEEKQRIESEKLETTRNRIADEKQANENARAAELETTENEEEKEMKTINDMTKDDLLPKWAPLNIGGGQIVRVDVEYLASPEALKLVNEWREKNGIDKPDVPQKATGTNNWAGGLVKTNEYGGEIFNLPNQTKIYPHDVSMEMARSMGEKLAESYGGGDISVTVPVYLDGKIIASSTSKIQTQRNKGKSRAWGVVPT